MPNNNNNTNFTRVAGQSAFFSASNRNAKAEELEILSQDLANSGDEVDGRFKDRHKETRKNEATGEKYRVVSNIDGLNNQSGNSPVEIKVDMVAITVGKKRMGGILGKETGAYLLTTTKRMFGEESVEDVWVESHGGFDPLLSLLGHREITLTSDMPTIVFLGPHNKILFGRLGGARPYAEVSCSGITLTSKQAKADFDLYGHKAITGTSSIGAIRDYDLSKFEGRTLGPAKDMYYRDYVLYYMADKRELEELLDKTSEPRTKKQILINSGIREGSLRFFDVITIRESGAELSACDTIKIAQEHNYKRIIFGFCRSNTGLLNFKKSEQYKTSETELLERPLFYSWDDIRTLGMEKGRVLESQEAPSCSTPRMAR